jgi:2-octaprenylphenol hydroxylase
LTDPAASAAYDVAVVGGGMVGATLAVALGERGFRVALVEARAPERNWPDDSHDLRVSAITHASQAVFERLGAWPAMVAAGVTPYRAMQVWDAPGFGEIRFEAAELGEPDLGHIIENRVIQAALWGRLEALGEAVRVICPAGVSGLEPAADAGVRRLWLDGHEPLSAALVVAADGARSRVRDLAGLAVEGRPYDQTAVVATVRPAHGHGETAWQRFMADGPLALLPLGEGLFSIVWSTSSAHADELLGASDAAFGAALTQASEGRVGDIVPVGPRAAFPLRLQRATAYVLPGIALVGDAAHVIHPLAGQGVNLGILDAAALVDVLVEARSARRRPGALATLRRYERARKGENLGVQYAMDGFKRVFGNALPPVRLVRNLGLRAANDIGPLKRLFARIALGSLGDLPTLARPGG